MNGIDVKKITKRTFKKRVRKAIPLFIMLLLPMAFLIVFQYVPMYGAQIAFREYKAVKGILGSDWVGLKYFEKIIHTPILGRLIINTLRINIVSMLVSFPAPILLALLLNYLPFKKYARVIQTASYLPHFISTIVIVGILKQMFNMNYGVVNEIIEWLGFAKKDFMGRPEYFVGMLVGSGVWQGVGWSAIIYIAALAAVDPCLHESAILDGACKLQRMWHIDLPTIRPTIVILFIMNFGSIMSTGFEKIFAMQTDLNMSVSETLNTYVYKIGLTKANYSYASAMGLFQSIISFILLTIVNAICKKLNDTSLF